MSSCEVNYPIELPLDCLSEIVRMVRGGTLASERQAFCQHAWVVSGYLLGRFVGSPQTDGLIAGESRDRPSDFEALAELDDAIAAAGDFKTTARESTGLPVAGAFSPGRKILAWLLQQLADQLIDRLTTQELPSTTPCDQD